MVATNAFPRAVMQDPVVRSIAYRATLCYGQLNRSDDEAQKTRLQVQLDAYAADLMDALRAASARLHERVTITPESVREFIESS